MQPEAIAVFSPIIIMGLCCGVLIIGFIVLVIVLVIKGRNQSWTGTVLKKHYNQTEDMDSDIKQDNYYLEVKLDDGKIRKIAVGKKMYDEVKDGDRLRKEKGQMWPKVIIDQP